MSNDPDPQPTCEEQLQAASEDRKRLREENELLRQAAVAFGFLAERLNTELKEERRQGEADRRRAPRSASVPRRMDDA